MLRKLDDGLWVAEAPLRYRGFAMGRRMAVVRLSDGGLWLHSPVPLTDEIRGELDSCGAVRFVVPASNLHGHLCMEQYAATYPAAELLATRPARDCTARPARLLPGHGDIVERGGRRALAADLGEWLVSRS